MKARGLGRGLEALLSADTVPETDRVIREIPIDLIDPNRDQPRKRFDEQSMRQLADSILQAGVLQPILLRPVEGRYQIIAGERRWRAARLAGLDTIPAILREEDALRRMEIALIENLQREDLNPIEEATAIRALMDECGLTQEAVAQRLGRSRPAIANLLRLLQLPEPIQGWIAEGLLTAGHARALAGVEARTRQITLAQQAIEAGWSVRQLEQAAAKKETVHPSSRTRSAPPELVELETTAREAFGLRVNVQGTLKRGRIVFQYHTPEELEQFYIALEGMRA